jgi:hypothetical protein
MLQQALERHVTLPFVAPGALVFRQGTPRRRRPMP